MRNISIRTKMLIFSFTAAALIILVWALSVSQFESTKIGSTLYSDIMLSNELRADVFPPPSNLVEPYATALEYIGTSDPIKREELFASYAAQKDSYVARYAYWSEHLDDAQLRQAFLKDANDASMHFFDVYENEVVPAAKAYNALQLQTAQRNLKAAYLAQRTAIEKVLALSDSWRENLLAASSGMSKRNSVLLIVFMAGGLLICALISWYITHTLVSSTKYVAGVMERIADGDLSTVIEDKNITRDEIGRLCASTKRTAERLNGYLAYIREITGALSAMADGDMRLHLTYDYSGEFMAIRQALEKIAASMNSTLSAIANASNRVNAGAKRIADGAQTLSQGVQAQASSIEQLTASIENVSGQAMDNASNVKSANEYIQQAILGIGQSNDSMHMLLKSIDQISKTSGEIGQIIKVIEDIAFQTNILALNAAVEAARAGAAGTGFAVVAGEVRSLAGKSAEAAKQTTELIQASQRAIREGVKFSENTDKELKDVGQMTEKIMSTINGIQNASSAQAAAIGQIRQGLRQISDVVQTNATASEQSAAASKEMFSQSTRLHEAVSRFTLDGAV